MCFATGHAGRRRSSTATQFGRDVLQPLTADTTQIKGRSAPRLGQALRNRIMLASARLYAMMVVTSPTLSGLAGGHSRDRAAADRLGRSVRRQSRAAQDTLAHASAYAGRQIGAIRTRQWPPSTRRHRAAVASRRAVETRVQAAALVGADGRADLRFAIFTIVFLGRGGVLWFGSRAVHQRRRCRPAAWPVPALCSCSRQARSARLWRRYGVNSPGGRRDRTSPGTLGGPRPHAVAARGAGAASGKPARRGQFRSTVCFHLPVRPGRVGAHGRELRGGARRDSGAGRSLGAGKSTIFC